MEARNLIITADRIAHGQGLNQKQWSEKSGHAKNGQTVSRIINKGDCRLSTFLELLKPLGYRLEIKEEDQDERAEDLEKLKMRGQHI